MTGSYTKLNVREILSFYKENALFTSTNNYDEKFLSLEFFYDFDEITIEVINQYCAYRSSQGVKNSTINREITVMRSAFNFYLKHKHHANFKNVFLGFRLFEKDFIPKYLNEVQCRKLLFLAKKYENPMLHDYILLLLNTGCRSGEILSLKWENVFIDDRYIIIRNSLSKNGKTIYKPLTIDCVFALARIQATNPDTEYVFFNRLTGKPYTTFRRGFKTLAERIGVPDLRIHDLRHTFASFLVQKGVPIYQVSTLLGHSDTRITQRYAHISPNYLHDALKALPTFS